VARETGRPHADQRPHRFDRHPEGRTIL